MGVGARSNQQISETCKKTSLAHVASGVGLADASKRCCNVSRDIVATEIIMPGPKGLV
jgi:hypothetical protein